jgi:hypothetical protein
VATPSGPATATAGARATAHADFNGDGYDDTAITARLAPVAGLPKAGSVVVVYGGRAGWKGARREVISQATPGVPGEPVANRAFGIASAAGDLDHDGYTDLALTNGPGGSSGDPHTIAVILWGGPRGLTGGTPIPSPVTLGDGIFYGSLAVADFNGDGKAELAVATTDYGMPDESRVWVYRAGITRAGPAGKPIGLAGPRDFPTALMAGDVTGDHVSDLVVLGGWEDSSPGLPPVLIYRGSATGLTPLATSETYTAVSAAIGDANGDGYPDLVLGDTDSRYDQGSDHLPDGGRVTLVYGSAAGLGKGRPAQVISEKSLGVPASENPRHLFGTSVALGDTNRDGYADLAVGNAATGGDANSGHGTVTLLRGSASGLTTAARQSFDASTPGTGRVHLPGDDFGGSLAFTDADHDGDADLLVAASSRTPARSALWLVTATPTGLTTPVPVPATPASGTPLFAATLTTGWPST